MKLFCILNEFILFHSCDESLSHHMELTLNENNKHPSICIGQYITK